MYGRFLTAPAAVRSAIAEGGILCAERAMAEGQNDLAVKVYDAIRKTDVPKQRIREATRGAILARGEDGIPLLIEQLNSSDKQMMQMALSTARQLQGSEVVEALSDELADAAPERASLIIYAIRDREDVVLPKSMLQAASGGDNQVRLAAIDLVGRLGDATAVPTLLEIAVDSNEEIAQAAKKALAGLAGKKVDAELAARLPSAKGKSLGVLIELVGERRIEATPELVKAMKNSDKAIREAALAALGETISAEDLNVLIAKLAAAKNDDDRAKAEKALHTASIRMPKREATAEELTGAMSNASLAVKASILRILGAMGGPKALQTIAAAIKSDDDQMQNIGTDVLGKWMTADAAPVLLEYAKDESNDKRYRDRAFKGYLRIARQLKQLPDEERLAIARKALAIAQRPDQRVLVLQVLERCPSTESIELASALVDDKEIRDQAVQTAIFIGEKIKDKDPAAAKAAGKKALEASPPKELAERARALTSP
jgi:HEAT repeat protein